MKEQLQTFLKDNNIGDTSSVNFLLQPEEERVVNLWMNLVVTYERELQNVLGKDYSKFDLKELPSHLQDSVNIVLTKSPGFSTIAATSVVTFTYAELFGQLRPKISDSVYSSDLLGINYNSFVLERSGSGKDSAYQAMHKTFGKAYEWIDAKKKEGQEEKAKKAYIHQEKQKDSSFDSSSVAPGDYQHLIKDLEQTNMSLKSTRGGITSSLNRLEGVELGTKSLFSSELAMALSGTPTLEIFELIAEMYDMGCAVAPDYKSEEVRESPVKDMYVNMLGISSPSMFLTSNSIKQNLVPLIKTALARRLFFINPKTKDNYENLIVASSTAENRELQARNRLRHRELSEQVSKFVLKSVKNTYKTKTLMFDEEASVLYSDYKAYTEYKAKIIATLIPGSVIAIEMEGRAFKLGRVAALWALAEDQRVITKAILESTIYFAEHSAEHLARFDKLITMKPHDLLASDYLEGIISDTLPVNQAIIKGYIPTANTGTIKAFLEPLNSTLKGQATVTYSTTENCFKFISTIKNVTVGDYSYTISPVLEESDRELTPNRVKDNVQLRTVGHILNNNAIFQPFGSSDLTKWVVLKIENSNLSAKVLNKYLSPYNRLISIAEDEQIINIVLPLDEFIAKKEYTYVVNSIATELMVKAYSSPTEVYQAYKDTVVLGKFDNSLEFYDVSDIRARYASKEPMPRLQVMEQGLTKTQRAKSSNKALELVEQSVDQIDDADNVLLTFAQVVRYMRVNHVSDIQLLDSVDSINSLLTNPISQVDKQQYLINPFKEV